MFFSVMMRERKVEVPQAHEFLSVWHPPISSPWHQQEFEDQFVVVQITPLIVVSD